MKKKTKSEDASAGRASDLPQAAIDHRIGQIAEAVAKWRDVPKETRRKPAAPTPEPRIAPGFLAGTLTPAVLLRSALAFALVAVFAVKPMQRLIATTSAEAIVNAPVITIRAPIDGEVVRGSRPLEIGAEGPVGWSAIVDFAAALNAFGTEKPVVVINSRGGLVEPALAIGRLLRLAGATVIVGHTIFP